MVKSPCMRSIFTRKRLVLFGSALALVLFVLLASGMQGFEFDLGEPVSWGESAAPVTPFPDVDMVSRPSTWERSGLFIAILLWGLLLLFLLAPGFRKRMLKFLFNLALTVLVLSYLYNNQVISLPDLDIAAMGFAEQVNAENENITSPPVFVPPDDSSALSYIVTFGLVSIFVFICWYLVRLWMRLRVASTTPDNLPDLATIARSSLRDISEGHDWQGVIQECYLRMSEAVNKNRGIIRQDAMTTGEFARRLEEAGLPVSPVRRLTHLFEAVRYGGKKSSAADIDEAVSSLNAILQVCEEAE